MTGGQVTGGQVTGGQVTGGQVTGGQVTSRSPWRRALFVLAAGFPFVFLAAFVAYPMWQEVGGSFSGWFQLKPHGFDGAANYISLFDDVVARVSALHTVFYLLLTVPAEVVLGLAAAWMTLRARRGQGALAAVFLLPMAVPWTVAGNLFYGLFNVGGVADRLAQDVFGAGASLMWFNHPRLAFGVIVVFGIWKGAPWAFLLLLGALSACPEEVFEAARVDGARGLTFWWRIVLPAVRPMLVFVIVLRLIAEAQTFNSVAMLTNGGPGFPGATELVGFYAQVLAFGYYNFGEAAALGTLVGVVLVVVAVAGWVLAFRPRVGRRRMFKETELASERPTRAHRCRHANTGPVGPVGSLRGSIRWAGRSRYGLLALMTVLAIAPFAGIAPFWQGRNELAGTNWGIVGTGAWNSLLLSAATLAGTLVLAVPAAYFLAYGKSRLRGALFFFVLFALAVPGVIFIFPQFEEIVWLGLVNTRLGIIVLYITANLPLAVFFLRPAFADVPQALVEAMRVDGASTFGVVRRLILRLSSSTIIALSVLIVVWVWGELPIAQAVLNSADVSASTLPLLLVGGATGESIGNPNGVYVISLAVPLLLFLAANRYFRRGLLSGSLI